MNTQLLTQPALICTFLVAEPEPASATLLDYGFDLCEEEITRELPTPLPASLSLQAVPEVEADEFEQVFQFFLS